MRIAFANDHAAVPVMRTKLLEHLQKSNNEIIDFGTDAADSVHYPDLADLAAGAVARGEADCAILVCGTGIGMSIAANKISGIRCALCTDEYAARMARSHNDANALALRGRRMDYEQNRQIIDMFLNTTFLGERHQLRIDKIDKLEERRKEK
jgi:ribose 5-phosphate isomerase B